MALKWKRIGYAAAAVGAGIVARAAADRTFTHYPSVYYQMRLPRLIAEFENAIDAARPLMLEKFGSAKAAEFRNEARAEFRVIIPQFPFIGFSSPWVFSLTSAGWLLAMYRVLKRRGYLLEEIGELFLDFTKVYVQRIPAPARQMVGQLWFSPVFRWGVQSEAKKSQSRRYPGNWEFNLVPSDGKTFDFGIDCTECAIVKFLKAQDAIELAPYICAIDRVFSEGFGWGLIRTHTIGEGAVYCDFRFKKGAQTQVASTVMPADAPRHPLNLHPELFED